MSDRHSNPAVIHHPNAEPLSRPAVLRELQRILSSQTFRRAPRLTELLKYVVHRSFNEGTIHERIVAREVFGKDEQFDPATDPTIRVQYGRLRRRLDQYFAKEGANDPVRIRVREREYKPMFEAQGATEPDISVVGAPESQESSTGRGTPSRKPEHTRPSIVVLPFSNFTNDPGQDVFCYGLTDDVISGLAPLPSVEVVARGSAFQFKNDSVDIRSVGRELGVGMVLEGSVRMESGQTRVSVQLAKVEDGFAFWSNTFDGATDGGIETQKEIARQIVETLPLREM